MKLWLNLVLLLAIGCGAGNSGAPPSAPSSSAVNPPMATHAQPKLRTVKLRLGAEQINAEQAVTADEQMTGMMFRTNLTDQDAMLFVMPFPHRASFWMKNCPESLSAAYIDPSGVIREIHHLEKQDTNSVVAASDNIQFVLEMKDGWFARHDIGPGVLVLTEFGTLQQTYFNRR